MPKPHGAGCDPLDRASRIPDLDVFADTEWVLSQKETPEMVSRTSLGSEAERDTDHTHADQNGAVHAE